MANIVLSEPTPKLRWRETATSHLILQQQYKITTHGLNGKVEHEWRDVPSVTSEEIEEPIPMGEKAEWQPPVGPSYDSPLWRCPTCGKEAQFRWENSGSPVCGNPIHAQSFGPCQAHMVRVEEKPALTTTYRYRCKTCQAIHTSTLFDLTTCGREAPVGSGRSTCDGDLELIGSTMPAGIPGPRVDTVSMLVDPCAEIADALRKLLAARMNLGIAHDEWLDVLIERGATDLKEPLARVRAWLKEHP